MTSELTRAELVELFNATTPENIKRLEEINLELQTRLEEIEKISETIARGGVRSLEELDALLKDLENHRARAEALKAEGDLMMADFLMDLAAINKLPR